MGNLQKFDAGDALMRQIAQVKPGSDAFQADVHLRLDAFAAQVVAAQIIDILPHPDYLAGMIGKGFLYIRHIVP